MAEGKEAQWREELSTKIMHLAKETEEEVEEIFVTLGVVAQSLHDLRASNVSLKHWYELKP